MWVSSAVEVNPVEGSRSALTRNQNLWRLVMGWQWSCLQEWAVGLFYLNLGFMKLFAVFAGVHAPASWQRVGEVESRGASSGVLVCGVSYVWVPQTGPAVPRLPHQGRRQTEGFQVQVRTSFLFISPFLSYCYRGLFCCHVDFVL